MSKASISAEEPAVQTKENVIFFVDIHGHSISDNIFMYGNKGPSAEENEEIREIPNLINQDLLQKLKDRAIRTKKSVQA